ncbi:hypothetical protein [Methanoplanus endosymbiosus]|uniref:Uncharacterized protein n=1 Tax=Methanoplanus endosymbiosus TaxID=33865 RepID=A0A9E7PPF8_9EURY|nr:hypothetical protein [Methanoplanus endosymbiosus]UUX92636.1 hypothetical protein L6E24_00475 [Methanoplanus endosymbiosus]
MTYMEELIKKLSAENRARTDIVNSLKKLNKPEENLIKKLILMKAETANIRRKYEKANLSEDFSGEINKILEGYDQEIILTENSCKATFGKELHDRLSELNISHEGQYPKYKLSNGLLYLTADLSSGKTKLFYGNEIEKIGECKTDPELIAKLIHNAQSTIFEREFDDESFISELKATYDIWIFKNNAEKNSEIKIVDLLAEIAFIKQDTRFRNNPSKLRYKDYTKVMLSYDLSKLNARTTENSELKLTAAKRSNTRSQKGVIWIPSKTRAIGETFSGIKFE